MAEVIDQLAIDLAQAKTEENEAREKRIAIEDRIVATLALTGAERRTVKTTVGLKLVVETGYNYKLAKDFDRAVVPHKETIKVELDAKAYNELPTDARNLASQYVTATPKKPSVTIAII
jgi:hypothetical protein